MYFEKTMGNVNKQEFCLSVRHFCKLHPLQIQSFHPNRAIVLETLKHSLEQRCNV